jgi:hypothetical protein
MNGSSYKYHNYKRFSIQTHLFAVLSTSVAFINWQSEEAIAVTVNREAAANVQNGTSSSTYRKRFVKRRMYPLMAAALTYTVNVP